MEKRIQKYITLWKKRCYKKDIPDDVPKEIFDRAPSYKKIALAILNNEHSLESLGFQSNKKDAYNAIKKEELKNRNLNYKIT
jgi:predicted phosphoadenosine phosphosulfate sulfurtransferase